MSRKHNFIQVFLFLFFICFVFVLQHFNIITIENFATSRYNGITSIITGVFLHANINHLVSNVSSLFITLPILLEFYNKDKIHIILLGLFAPSACFYMLNLNMIGISGLCFAVTWFIIISGFASKDKLKFVISIILFLQYQDTLNTLFPSPANNIAWQAHLVGFIVAVGSFIANNIFKEKIPQ